MIILDDTTTTLEIDLTGAVTTNQLPFVACYVDISTSTFAITGAATNTGTSNNTTAVTAVTAPGASTSRQIKYFSWKNSDTVVAPGWVQLNENGTLREIWKGTLAVDDTLVYMDGAGWSVINSSGAIKTSFANTFTATRVPFAGADGILTTDSGFTFNTTGDILTVGAINFPASGTAPGIGWYSSAADTIRTPNLAIVDKALTVSGARITQGGSTQTEQLNLRGGSVSIAMRSNGATDTSNIYFYDSADVIQGGFRYDHSAESLVLSTNGFTAGITISSTQAVTLAGNLTVSGTSHRIDGGTTGAQTATFSATNKPGTGTAGPTAWLPLNSGGTQYYIPLFGA